MEETTMESASAAPSNVLVEQMQSLLDRNYERQGERYDFLFKKLEKRLLTRQIQREQERDEKASQESAALMGELSSLKEAVKKSMISLEVSEITEDWVRSMHGEIEARHDTYHRATSNRLSALEQLLQGLVDSTQQQQQDMKTMLEQVIENQTTAQEQMSSLKQDMASLQDVVAANEKDNTTTNVSSLQQQVESVQKTVNTVEMNCTKMKSNVAVMRSVVANIELKCIQTNDSVKSFGTELSSFIEERDDASYVSPGEEDDDDDDSNSDDQEFEEDEEDGIDDNANNGRPPKRKRGYTCQFHEPKWQENYGKLLEYFTTHDKYPTMKMLDNAYPDFNLGRWVRHQRTTYKNKRISDEHVTLLKQVPGWTWY